MRGLLEYVLADFCLASMNVLAKDPGDEIQEPLLVLRRISVVSRTEGDDVGGRGWRWVVGRVGHAGGLRRRLITAGIGTRTGPRRSLGFGLGLGFAGRSNGDDRDRAARTDDRYIGRRVNFDGRGGAGRKPARLSHWLNLGLWTGGGTAGGTALRFLVCGILDVE